MIDRLHSIDAMGALKKTALMFAASLTLFLILSVVGDYQKLFLNRGDVKVIVADPYDIERTLKAYINKLSGAYLDPGVISEIPMSDELLKELADEIEFLRSDGRVVEMEFKNLWIQNINQVAPDKVRVSTQETIAVRYLRVSDRSEIRAIPPAVFQMSYVLEHGEKGWKVIRYDVEEIKEIKAVR